MPFAADAPTFLADMGESVSWTESALPHTVRSGLMLFDQPDSDIQSGAVKSREYEVTFETAAWPSLRRGEVLVIGGAGGGFSYTLRTDPDQLEDAVFSRAKLSKV